MTTTHDTDTIAFIAVLGDEFRRAELEQATSAKTARSRWRPRPRLRGPLLAALLALAAGTGAAAATVSLPGFSSSTDGLTPVVKEISGARSVNVGAYMKGELFCLRVAEPSGSADFTDTCADLSRPPYSEGDHAVGIMLQQVRPSGTTLAGVASVRRGTVRAVDADGRQLAAAPVLELSGALTGDRDLGTFVMQLPPGTTAARVD